MSISIRIAKQEDAAAIAQLSRQTFYETFAQYNTRENMDKFMQEQFSIELLVNEVSKPGNTFITAYMEKELVGYAKLSESANPAEIADIPAIEICRIYSSTNTIGKGVGKSLMQECIEIASGMNKKMIWLGVWEHNLRAISFYEKWGFSKFSEHPFILGNDVQVDWLMAKKLNS